LEKGTFGWPQRKGPSSCLRRIFCGGVLQSVTGESELCLGVCALWRFALRRVHTEGPAVAQRVAQRERARQRKLHELAASNERDLKVSPGRHCSWCPLLLNGCPVAQTNPYSQLTAEQRLRFALWLQEAEKQNPDYRARKNAGQIKMRRMRRKAIQPFERFTANAHSPPDSLDSDPADDLSRSPLFAALGLPRPGE
jgi:hypothetical protein